MARRRVRYRAGESDVATGGEVNLAARGGAAAAAKFDRVARALGGNTAYVALLSDVELPEGGGGGADGAPGTAGRHCPLSPPSSSPRAAKSTYGICNTPNMHVGMSYICMHRRTGRRRRSCCTRAWAVSFDDNFLSLSRCHEGKSKFRGRREGEKKKKEKKKENRPIRTCRLSGVVILSRFAVPILPPFSPSPFFPLESHRFPFPAATLAAPPRSSWPSRH
ncbi:hypothetical protein GGS23DRAFT_61314 [Durotheca rogersii]|uniref:uncharacterized protein n=1 Tax=Durotheca rogersii TaxID=419775 RepID=UPI00221EA589|nr:uncharacterized protein GGS23DRAFT_61314 [Durotheca rogersii]KAI5863256.1 hypothetical protein GGS23DRAFT_61314 [Durotheca rogersii]